MLLFQAEGAADFAALLLAVPEPAVVDLEVVARPGPPTGELARRRLHGAIMAGNGIFRHGAHRVLPTATCALETLRGSCRGRAMRRPVARTRNAGRAAGGRAARQGARAQPPSTCRAACASLPCTQAGVQ